MPKSKNVITADLDTLKKLVSEGPHSWLHKTLTTLLVCNIGVILSLGGSLISDHYSLKSVVVTTAAHSTQINDLNNRETKAENQLSIHDTEINNLQKRK